MMDVSGATNQSGAIPLEPAKASKTSLKHTFTKMGQRVSVSATRIGESFKRKAIQVLSPPKSGPGSGLVKRAKTDTTIAVRGTLHSPDHKAVKDFHEFDVVPKVPFDTPPLTQAQVRKAQELGLETLISAQKPKATRNDFDPSTWKQLDAVNFALTQEHLESLCTLFNSDYHAETANNFSAHGNWNESLIAETLAKALAYTEDLSGNTIRIPVKNGQQYELKEFTITNFPLGEQLPCYVLTAEGEKSWIVPRGTEISKGRTASMESILADCDPKGIANRILDDAKKTRQLEELFYHAGENANIAGHSLGGLLANELAARYPDKLAHSYGFSAPGISRVTFNGLTDAQKAHLATKITNFQTEGDLVPSAGHHYIGKNFAVSTEAKDAIHAHLQHNLNRPGTSLTVIDNRLESQKLLHRISESTRKNVGGALLKVTNAFSKNKPSWMA
ncbi:MAG: hypothetical protein LLF94_05105 [Chlamydiales bacterium]|nr:hypothetical protein [Chlamydiales bacterium]